MREINVAGLSDKYLVRRLTLDDVDMIYLLCKGNTQYYEYCGKDVSRELIEHDLTVTPPGIPQNQKYYVGFFEDGKAAAIMDLISGYPDGDCAFIGFFMMRHELSGMGIGSKIITEVLLHLKSLGFTRCMLGIDKGNPQSTRFWAKNGFEVIREVAQSEGAVLVAEKKL